MKDFFSGMGKFIGYWIMWLGLFAIICPFLFPFPMWPEIKNIFDIVIFIFPVGFVLRFIAIYDKSLIDRSLYLVKDIAGMLILVSIASLTIPVVYFMYHNTGQEAILKGAILVAIGIVGYILMSKYIKDMHKKKKNKKTK